MARVVSPFATLVFEYLVDSEGVSPYLAGSPAVYYAGKRTTHHSRLELKRVKFLLPFQAGAIGWY